MCLSLPYRVVDVPGPAVAVVTRQGVTVEVSMLAAVDPVAPGDWVLVHSGFVLRRLSDDEVRELATTFASAGGPG
jgi:hydrogenase expression/formation protein HypC